MAGYSFGRAPRAPTYYHNYLYDSSSTTDQTSSQINRNQQRIRVQNEMTYTWEPNFKEIKIDRPNKAFMEYTRDLGLDEEFIKKLKSDVLKLRSDKTIKISLGDQEENVRCQAELMFDPENLVV